MYMAVGGYNSNFDIAEDVFLGRMIKAARSGAGTRRPIGYLGRSSEVMTSGRRAVGKLLSDGGAPAQQWDSGFGPDDLVRSRRLVLNPADLDDPENIRRLIPVIESFLNTTLKVYSSSLDRPSSMNSNGTLSYDTETIRQINRILWAIGVQPKWLPNGEFEIIRAERMIENLKRWQTEH
jgi:hypothetical protein